MNRIRSIIAACLIAALTILGIFTADAVAQAVPLPSLADSAPAAQAGQQQQASLADVIERAEAGVVVVLVPSGVGRGGSQGSGFFVDPRHVVTNRHVVEDGASATVKLQSGRASTVAGIVAEDRVNDLVLLQVDIPADAGHRPLPLHPREPRKGETVLVLGAPRGLEFSVSQGIVSAVRPFDGRTSDRVIQTTAPISPGNSGGPVINATGEVLGVASFTRVDGQNLNFAQGAWHVADLRPGNVRTLAQWQAGRAEEVYQQASDRFSAKQYSQAIPLLVKVVKAQPNHHHAWFDLGFALGEVGQHDHAVTAYQQHLRMGVTGVRAAVTLYNMAVCSKNAGKMGDAKHYCEEALEHDSGYIGALKSLGAIAFVESRWEDAVKYFTRLAALHPTDPAVQSDLASAINNIGNAEMQAGRNWTAVRRFQEALQADPGCNIARLNLGLAAYKLGYGGTVRQMYNELLARDPALAQRLRRLVG